LQCGFAKVIILFAAFRWFVRMLSNPDGLGGTVMAALPCSPRPFSTAHAALLAAIVVTYTTTCSINPAFAPPPSDSVGDANTEPRVNEPAFIEAMEILKQSGWSSTSASKVVDLNFRYFSLLHGDDHPQYLTTLSILARLGRHPAALKRLRDVPELAGLLAGSLEVDENGPQKILATIPRDIDNQRLVMSLYGLSPTPKDSLALAAALDRDQGIMLRLFRRDAADALSYFINAPKSGGPAEQYRKWLRSVFKEALDDDDNDALDRAQCLLTIHAHTVRLKLESDPAFCEAFLEDLWPKFDRVLSQQPDDFSWGMFVGDPRVWGFLAKFGEHGVSLLSSYGALAIDLLMDPNYEACQTQVLSALASGDELTIQVLYDDQIRQQPLFVKLLQRELPGPTLANALGRLAAKPGEVPRLLLQFDHLSNEALIEDLGSRPEGIQTWLPGYNIYYLGRKWEQGREVEGMDALWAAVDVVEIVFMAKGASKGLKAIQLGVREGLIKKGLPKAAAQAAKTSSRELAPLVLREGQRAIRTAFHAIRNAATIDVTDAVRFAFKKSGIGLQWFKNLTALDARIFMRADRRVAIDLAALAKNDHIIGRLLRESAINGGFDLAFRTPPGRATAEATVTAAAKTADVATRKIRAWKEHLALWWLVNNDGSLKLAVPK
jgi:hypothetical protein